MKIRDIVISRRKPNNGERALFESAISDHVVQAIKDWQYNSIEAGVLVGGMAFSYYAKPRYTEDVDVLFISKNKIPKNVDGFKRHREHAFEHKKTGVEIELLVSGHIPVPVEIIKKVIDTANLVDGIKIASPSGLVAMKLYRASYQDKSDIIQLINSCNVNISSFPLDEEQYNLYNQLNKEASE